MMLYRVLKRTIQRGGYDAVAMHEKLDVFFAADRITEAQYNELTGMLSGELL